jgi:16S rRNA (cytidine1402-2'-O)-methyltransferase
MPGTLFIVATPIGNLEDLSFRAARVLRSVGLIAAEDTRHTATLLQHYDIPTPATSFHEHNERQKLPALIDRLKAGVDLALVTDAGTPAVSDPGYRLVRAAIDAGARVEAIPGPSAVLAALVVSGLPTDSFTFLGFPPARARARREWLEQVAQEPRTLVLFEAPHRVRDTLAAALEVLGDREATVGRELTKLHEEVLRGPLSSVLARLEHPRGEMTIVVAPPAGRARSSAPPPSDAELWHEFQILVETEGRGRREAVSALASRHRLSSRSVYAALERGKNGLNNQT